MTAIATIKTGDTVRHGPTGEEWSVAYVDPENDRLAWSGWPEGYAKLSDCELIESCSDVESETELRKWAENRDADSRTRRARNEFQRRARAILEAEHPGDVIAIGEEGDCYLHRGHLRVDEVAPFLLDLQSDFDVDLSYHLEDFALRHTWCTVREDDVFACWFTFVEPGTIGALPFTVAYDRMNRRIEVPGDQR